MIDIKEPLLAWLEGQAAPGAEPGDITEKAPGLSDDDAYRLQFALAQRKLAKGERLIGYKAAHTSLAIQREQNNGVSIGSLLSSYQSAEDAPLTLRSGVNSCAEPEIGVLLKRDLVGPGVTITDAFQAVECVFPSIEIVTYPKDPSKRSRQMMISMSKTSGAFLLGGRFSSPLGLDLRLEGVVISVNGAPVRSAAGVEAMGHPMNVLAAVANRLGGLGQPLRAGMIVMTGSLTNNIPLKPADEVLVEFTRLGSIAARIAA